MTSFGTPPLLIVWVMLTVTLVFASALPRATRRLPTPATWLVAVKTPLVLLTSPMSGRSKNQLTCDVTSCPLCVTVNVTGVDAPLTTSMTGLDGEMLRKPVEPPPSPVPPAQPN
jgi:hypothetical protein